MQTGGPHLDSTASSEPSAVQLQLAERIADAVAARLNQRAALSSAEPLQQIPSSAPSCNDAAPVHADAQAPEFSRQGDRQPTSDKHAETSAEPSMRSLERKGSQRHACEEDFLAAFLQGSPGRLSSAGQRSCPQACEQDFLAALLLTPGTSGRTSHAASPGLMHRDSCSTDARKAAAMDTAADSRVQPWSAQWAGKLTQQQMEAAVQEVSQHNCPPGPQACHIPDEMQCLLFCMYGSTYGIVLPSWAARSVFYAAQMPHACRQANPDSPRGIQ